MQEDPIFARINKKAHKYACLYADKLKNIKQEDREALTLYGGILGDFSVLLSAGLHFTSHVK